MNTTPQFTEDDAKIKIRHGVHKLARAVSVTLGPKGLNVMIDRGIGAPIVTKDGVTVARSINLPDRLEAMGAELVKQAATRSNDLVGDGTTTATVLADALITHLSPLCEKLSPQIVRHKLEQAVNETLGVIAETTRQDISEADILRVATISSNDDIVGRLVADAYDKVGKHGIVLVETAKDYKTKVDMIDGCQFDSGFASPYFSTDNYRQVAELAKPLIYVTDRTFRSFSDIVGILDYAVKQSKSLAIIAADFEGEALSNLIANKMKGIVNVVAIKAPGLGDRQKQYLQDIATYTGATFLSDDLGNLQKAFNPECLGSSEKIIADATSFTITNGSGDKTKLAEYISTLNEQRLLSFDEWEQKKFDERIARLSGGVAIIRVGGETESELIERKHRVIDAVSATRAAILDGIVPGGGVALVRGASKLQHQFPEFFQALTEPFRKILINAGKEREDTDAFLETLLANSNNNFGFDSATGERGDLIQMGIIDPFKVTKSALLNGASVAAMILTTEAAVVEVK